MCAPLLGSVISRRCLNRLLSVQRLASTAPQQPLRWRSRTYYAPVLAARPPSQEPFEEENHPKYSPQRFCSVIPGDLVHDGRYCIISKLGWGGGSTVWLAEDQHPFTDSRYVTISFGNRAREENRQAQLDLLQRLAFADPQHSGHALVRQPSDDFEIKTDDGTHLCLVYTPLRMTLHSYSKLFPNEQLPLPLVKAFTYMLLHGLDYLHTSCNIIHTGLVALDLGGLAES